MKSVGPDYGLQHLTYGILQLRYLNDTVCHLAYTLFGKGQPVDKSLAYPLLSRILDIGLICSPDFCRIFL